MEYSPQCTIKNLLSLILNEKGFKNNEVGGSEEG